MVMLQASLSPETASAHMRTSVLGCCRDLLASLACVASLPSLELKQLHSACAPKKLRAHERRWVLNATGSKELLDFKKRDRFDRMCLCMPAPCAGYDLANLIVLQGRVP